MSVEAITWALAQPVKQSSAKFVLVILANRADGDMICWPSMTDICKQTSQDRKTVLENMRRLRDSGFIEDTGIRKGSTGQVIVYRLKTPEIGTVKEAQKRNGSENGTGPKFPSKRPEIPAKQARNSHETGPKTGHGTINESSVEPSINHQKRARPEPFVLPDWIPADAWDGYIEMRKKKNKPPTDRARNLVIKELAKLLAEGHDLEAVLDNSTKNGWTDVYAPKAAKQSGPPARQQIDPGAAQKAANEEAKRLLFGPSTREKEVIDV
jgi:hypothetical protein